MRIIQTKLTLTALIFTISLASIGLSSSAAVIDNQNNCTTCSMDEFVKKCPGNCPDGYGESIDINLDYICPNSTFTETKTCHKCRIESCKSCNVSMSSDVHVCFQCLDNFTLDNNTCTNNTNGGNPGKDDTDNGALIGGVVGGVLGGAAVITLIVLVFIYLRHRRRQGERIIERGSENEMSDKITQSTENGTQSKREVHLQMPKTEDIQRAHDHVTRYTKDPTEHVRSLGLSQRSETAELEDLGLAPPPPSECYDFPDPANRDDPQSYSPVLQRKHPVPEEDNDELYINNASLREADSTYGNASVFRPDYDFPGGPKSNMPAPVVAKDEPSTVVVGRSEIVDDEPQEIYLNEYVDTPTAALVREDEDGPQEIYMNENLDSDDIYQNMCQ